MPHNQIMELKQWKTLYTLVQIISPKGDGSREIRMLRLGRAAMKELEKIVKCKGVENKVKIIHTLVFPIIVYRCESWTLKKGDGENV